MKIIDTKELRKNAKQAAKLLKTVANPERLMILCHLVSGERSAGDLWSKSKLSQSAFSQHLGVLRKHNIVSTRKEMQTVYYTLTDDKIFQLLNILHSMYC